MNNTEHFLELIRRGDFKTISRSISLIENESPGYAAILSGLQQLNSSLVIGVTGPPGSGKSTLVDGLIGQWISLGKKIAVLCVDPSSPFHYGALLGDRIRMSEWYNHPKVFIRSLATRGSLGGLHPKIIEITDLLRSASFDYIIIETVGVGQSEIEIAGLADTTVVVMVPEAGDEIQTMKAGIMEIADIFVVNKADHSEADKFVRHIESVFEFNSGENSREPIVIKTIATEKKGLPELTEAISAKAPGKNTPHKIVLLAEKAYQLIVQKRMRDIEKQLLEKQLKLQLENPGFNLYKFIEENYKD